MIELSFFCQFDDDGNLINWSGEPIQLNETVPEDPKVLQILEKYGSEVNEMKKYVIGVSKVPLDGSKCHFNECNVGNLITDAYIHARAKQYNGPQWTDASIALMQAAGVRDSACAGNITTFDLRTIITYNNSLVVINSTGVSLIQALEHAAAVYPEMSNYFLQVSGIRVAYDIANPPGQRVRSVKVLCSDCEIPFYSELEPDRKYGVVLTSYLHKGGDNFSMFKVNFNV